MREDVEMTFGEHLEELRRRVIYALVGLLVASVFCGINYKSLLTAMIRPYRTAYVKLLGEEQPAAPKPDEKEDPAAESAEPEAIPGANPALAEFIRKIDRRLAAIEARVERLFPETAAASPGTEAKPAPSGKPPPPSLILGGPLTGYVTIILLCVICGMILGSPWILYQMWAFIGVGLHPHERKFIHIYGPFSFFLFVGGAATFYFVMLPVALQALMTPTSGIEMDGVPLIDASFFLNDYFKFVAMMTLIFGVVFQTPLVVMFLARTEIVPLGTLVKQQKIVLMVLVVLSAVLTPQDPVTMVMMAIPLVLLYWLGLLFSWISIRRRQRREARGEGEEPWDDYERENEGPWKPDREPTGEQAAPEQPEPDKTEPTAEGEQPEDQAEDYEDPYAEFQGDDEAHGYDDDYSWEQETYGESEADADEQESPDGAADKPEGEGEPPPDEAPADHEPSGEDRPDEPQDEADEMPGDDDLPPEDRMK